MIKRFAGSIEEDEDVTPTNSGKMTPPKKTLKVDQLQSGGEATKSLLVPPAPGTPVTSAKTPSNLGTPESVNLNF